MIITQHYLYYADLDNHAMILIRLETQPNGQNRYEWISHLYISDYTPPLLFSYEKLTTLLKQEDWQNFDVQIGDWVSLQRCRQNLHRYEQA
jgi:hypothetical protein